MDIANTYGTLELQLYYLPILSDLDKLCREYGINYTISDGTLIGAIRHKGFIPWDDDIDVSFDRDNYNKLLEVLEQSIPEQYTIVYDLWVRRITRKDNPKKDNVPPEGCIDLLVFDNAPDGRVQNALKNLCLKMLQGMIKKRIDYEKFNFGYKVALFCTHYIGKIFSHKFKQKCYQTISQWGNKKQTRKKARYSCSYRYISGVRYDYSLTDEYIDVEFEGRYYMAVKDYDSFLRSDFGDYMELPPEEERIPIHKN